MTPQHKVMISSTARDLPEHRHHVVEACLRQGMFPLRMEDLPASSDEAAAASVRMVDEADVYVGIFAHRYGYVPRANNPNQISVTEMEYDRAVARRIPRLIFIMDDSHPIKVSDVDFGPNSEKLLSFKGRVQTENIIRFFKSPPDLRAEVINSLSQLARHTPAPVQPAGEAPSPHEGTVPSLLANFVLDAEGKPKFRRSHYEIKLFIKDPPPGTSAVKYLLHESFEERLRVVERGVPEFEEYITTYGDFKVKVIIIGQEVQEFSTWLTSALERYYKDRITPDVLHAIKYLEDH